MNPIVAENGHDIGNKILVNGEMRCPSIVCLVTTSTKHLLSFCTDEISQIGDIDMQIHCFSQGYRDVWSLYFNN